jgi:hypothetical protein
MEKQTKQMVSDKIQKQVYHRNDLRETFYKQIKGRQNILLLIDEVHIASKVDTTMCNTFKKVWLLSKDYLYENDIKIVEFSATPNGTLYDLLKWPDSMCMLQSQPSKNYMSSNDFLLTNRVRQFKDLSVSCENLEGYLSELRNDIDSFKGEKYHLIRTKTSFEQIKTVNNLKAYLKTYEFDYSYYDGTTDIIDINDILESKPSKNTFILIKELIRCAKTLNKIHIGVLYERYVNLCDDSTIIQGLFGRATGYDDTGETIIYTNIKSIENTSVYGITILRVT